MTTRQLAVSTAHENGWRTTAAENPEGTYTARAAPTALTRRDRLPRGRTRAWPDGRRIQAETQERTRPAAALSYRGPTIFHLVSGTRSGVRAKPLVNVVASISHAATHPPEVCCQIRSGLLSRFKSTIDRTTHAGSLT